ncbi:TPA: NADAR family protein [Bacillus cereus]|nr:NADAR family protein [Bacillus cereus]
MYFRKTKEKFGGLSNMAAGYPLFVNNIKILTSEALYQACRYPHLPGVQWQIIDQKSPMTAKMKSKKYKTDSRKDWDRVRLQIMRWSIRVKLVQNWGEFSQLLLSTDNKDIVEESLKDDFWGAIPFDRNLLVGTNALGRLLMELREELKLINPDEAYILKPPQIENFKLFGRDIKSISFKVKSKEANNNQLNLFDNK